jgi:hypothetical protein
MVFLGGIIASRFHTASSSLSPHAEAWVEQKWIHLAHGSHMPWNCLCYHFILVSVRGTSGCRFPVTSFSPPFLLDFPSPHLTFPSPTLNLSIMLDTFVSALLRHWPSALAIIFLVYIASNHFKHGLNRYPGPFVASLTNWWRFFDVYGRRPEVSHIKLHRQHGDVVRLGPNVLSFADPAAIKQIYGLNKGFTKVRQDPCTE